MGDRCYVSVTLRKRDLDRFGAATGWFDYWSLEGDDGDVVSVDMDEVNYGGDDDLDTAASLGIRFYGHHGAGCAYGPEWFLGDGTRRIAIPTDADGYAMVRYDPETGKPDDELGDKRRIKQFAVKLRQVKQFIKGKETDG